MQEDHPLVNKPIFRDHKMPVARAKGGLPIFLDFSSGGYPGESLLPNFINEAVSKTTNFIDGVILSPQNLLDISLASNKEVWVRAGYMPASDPANPKGNETALYAQDLSQNAVSGMVGDLVLGCSASEEAHAIQTLAYLRSLSTEVGIPLVIDIQVVDQSDDEDIFLEIVELGLNLAVELGSNIMILPGGGYLSAENHIDQITENPLFIKQPIGNALLKNQFAGKRNSFNTLSGVILTDFSQCEQKNIDPGDLMTWAYSLWAKEPESGL